MSIRTKMLLPMILIAVAAIAAVLVTVSIIFSGYVDDTIREEVNVAGGVLKKEADDLKNQADIVAGEMASSSALQAALAAGDTDAVLRAANTLLDGTGMGICTITNRSAVVVARTHNPSQKGDTVQQDDILLALKGQEYNGFEEGTTVALAVRAAMPVYDADGNLIGAVSVGRDLSELSFVDEMKALLGAEITIFHRDTRLATTVVNADGSRAVGTQASSEVANKVLGTGQDHLGTAQILGRDAYVEYMPLQDENGENIGMLFAGKYTDVKNDAMLSFILISLGVGAGLLAIAVVLGLYISGKTVAPIKTLVGAAGQIAQGDVNVQLDIQTKDETKQLADAFEEMMASFQHQAQVLNAMAGGDYSVQMDIASDKDVVGKAIVDILDNNNHLMSDIRQAADHVAAGAGQIADGSQALATGSTQQAATVEELSASISQIQVQSEETTQLAEKTVEEVDEAGRLMTESIDVMGRLNTAMAAIEESSQEISKVIKTIDDIAFQTNILALNAAVEAARAGQHGKGFAVVADEVRNLASKSAEAAKETAGLIQTSVDNVKQGAQLVEQTSQSLAQVGEIAGHNAVAMKTVSEASSQQAAAITEVNTAIGQISQVIQANSATAEESAATAEELNAQSAILNQNVGRFRLRQAGGAAGALPAYHAGD
ncbi:methyl-accepting chemotaxis protein [Ruminococcaceae bacterium OttesenSCG-928-O06]|nr:methyl-accepting chemotaxis protein [Ruminococcaceae bacterium OttesenSCG-928-O06]